LLNLLSVDVEEVEEKVVLFNKVLEEFRDVTEEWSQFVWERYNDFLDKKSDTQKEFGSAYVDDMMNFYKNRVISNGRKQNGKRGFCLGLLLGLAMLLAACGESAPMDNVVFPIPTVTPFPTVTELPAPAATPAQPSPVAQPVNVKPQALDRLPVIEGDIEAVAVENNLSVLTVNQTRYTIIPEITNKIGKWFKVGNHIKMSGTRYSDGTNLITLVVNVTTPSVAQPKKNDKDNKGGDD